MYSKLSKDQYGELMLYQLYLSREGMRQDIMQLFRDRNADNSDMLDFGRTIEKSTSEFLQSQRQRHQSEGRRIEVVQGIEYEEMEGPEEVDIPKEFLHEHVT